MAREAIQLITLSYVRTRGQSLEHDYRWVEVPAIAVTLPAPLKRIPELQRAFRSDRPFTAAGIDAKAGYWLVHGVRSRTRQDAIGRAIFDSAIVTVDRPSASHLMVAAHAAQAAFPYVIRFDDFIYFDDQGDFAIRPSWQVAMDKYVGSFSDPTRLRDGKQSGVALYGRDGPLQVFEDHLRPWTILLDGD